jgi:hypothetical protein
MATALIILEADNNISRYLHLDSRLVVQGDTCVFGDSLFFRGGAGVCRLLMHRTLESTKKKLAGRTAIGEVK